MTIYKNFKLFAIAIILVLTGINVFSQNIRNDNLVYDDNIKTVLLHRVGDQLTDPIIKLNAGEKLKLEFDDFSDQSYNFKYTIIHCDRNWKTSDLDQIEYINGNPEGYIEDFKFSLNAIPSYIHYDLIFPGDGMSINYSGNYIIKVYLDDDSDDNVILTRRFFVVEPLVNIETKIPYYSSNLDYTRKKQQIDLKIFTPDQFNNQPDERIKVFIQQNGRLDNMVRDLAPTSVLSNQLNYNYANGIIFDGGNQFRNFDMKSFYYQSMYIKKIISDANGYTVILHTDYSKAKKQYEKVADIHGRKLIKARNDQETDIEGEYAWVDFTLNVPEFEDADVYIIGALNDWLMNDNNRMKYDSRYQAYKKTMFLKQGYYDYMYCVVPKGKTVGDITLIEGDWWDTLNEYKIYVYYDNLMPEYDRLVGYKNFLSHYDEN